MINVSVLGYGTVGSGVFDIIRENNAMIENASGMRSVQNMCWT